MLTLDGKQVFVYDIEVFPNFFLAQFWDGNKIWHEFRETDIGALIDFLHQDIVLAGFNNFNYDDVMMKWICINEHVTTTDIYGMSSEIITGGRDNQKVFKLQYSKSPWSYSLDVFQFFNKKGSLKEWECKEQLPYVIESPCDFTKNLPDSHIDNIVRYCNNDVKATHHLLKKNWHLVQVRSTLIDTYDLSERAYVVGEAGLAQMVFLALHSARTGEWINKVRDRASINTDNKAREWSAEDIVFDCVKYRTKPFKAMLAEFMKTSLKGDARGARWNLDDKYKKSLQLGMLEYKLGVGGLHSVDGPGVFEADEENAIIDLDVTSYYPSIIVQENLFPKQLGPDFVEDMRTLRTTRIAAKEGEKKAKKAGDKEAETKHKHVNAALKVVLNSTFGKLNDVYSPLRSTPDALRITINGQLMLLMLVEMLETAGATILSANTDGVTVRWDRKEAARRLPRVIDDWQSTTGYELEQVNYDRLCRRDVNAYLAVKDDGEVKRKGAFDKNPLTGKWDRIVVKIAAEAYLLRGVDPKRTIFNHEHGADFLFYQKIGNGGTVFIGDTLVGKVARWYVTKNGPTIKRRNPDGSFASIPCGYNAVLAMDIHEWRDLGPPGDLDKNYYVTLAWDLINSTKKGSHATDTEDQ